MDKYEYRRKTEQMLAYIDQKSYVEAMEIADTIDWRRVKNTVMLCATSEVYEQNNQLNKSRDVLFIAYDRAPENKKIIYRLGVLALKQGDLAEAMDCYDEFVNIAPKDPNQYILRYKVLRLQGSSVLLQIEALKAFRAVEYVERWAYELVKLYDEAGMTAECMSECDDMIMWFGQGKYLKDTLEFKLKYDALTDQQVELYEQFMPQPELPPTPEPVQYVEQPVVEFQPKVDLGDTQIIGQEELQQIQDSDTQDLMQTIPIDTKAIRAAHLGVAPPIVVRGPQTTLETANVAAGIANVAAAATVAGNGLGSVVNQIPTKTRSNSLLPETTGQLRIDEILSGWEQKQKVVEEAIAVEKVKGEEKLAQEAKVREEERLKKEIEKAENDEPVLPDDIRRMIEDIEGGVDLSETTPIHDVTPEILEPKEKAPEIENKGVVLQNDLYIQEEFHDNIFEAEEEYTQLLSDVEPNPNAAQVENEKSEEALIDEMAQGLEAAIEIEEQKVSEQSEEKQLSPIAQPLMPVETQTQTPVPVMPQEPVIAQAEVPLMEDIEAILTQGDLQESLNQSQTIQNKESLNNDQFLDGIGEEKAPLSRIEMAKAVATGRTSKIPSDDINRSLGGVSQDTGFIVQAKYDLDAQSQVGLKAGLSEEQKQMFSYFVPVRGMSEQLVDVLERDKSCVGREGTSSTGNLLIVGRKGSGKTVLAVDVVKAIQKNREIQNGKVAIVTGDALNKKKISDIIGKLYGGALIIEKASRMNDKTITRLNKAMERDTGEMLIVLEDERKPLDSVLATNFEFRRRFTSRLEVPVFINDELVTFGQTYAKENGYKIDEMGILALYSRIDSQQREDYNVSVADVKDIMDEAIGDSQKGGVKKLAQKLFNKNDSTESFVLLSEKNFNI